MAVKASATITLSFLADIKAVYRYYKLQASTTSAPTKPINYPPSGWTETEPSYTSGSTNTLYFVDLTILTNDTWSYSIVSKSSSYEAAKEAYNKAQNAQDTAIETAKKYTDAQIKVSANDIKSEVSETYVTKDNASSTYAKSTDLQQTSDSFQMNFKTLQTTVLDNQHNVDEQFSELNDYIRFQGGNIILGKSGNSITCKITNDRLSFMQDDVEVAYLSNNQLYINKANVTNKLQIGNFVFQAKSDGGLSVVKNT